MKLHGEFFADKLMDLANLSGAILIFGQWVSSQIQWDALALGCAFYVTTGVVSYKLRGGM